MDKSQLAEPTTSYKSEHLLEDLRQSLHNIEDDLSRLKEKISPITIKQGETPAINHEKIEGESDLIVSLHRVLTHTKDVNQRLRDIINSIDY